MHCNAWNIFFFALVYLCRFKGKKIELIENDLHYMQYKKRNVMSLIKKILAFGCIFMFLAEF